MMAQVQYQTFSDSQLLADMAVEALIDEVNLTPKPALVDRRGSGAHDDLTLELMERSAKSLGPMFEAMALLRSITEKFVWPYAKTLEKLAAKVKRP